MDDNQVAAPVEQAPQVESAPKAETPAEKPVSFKEALTENMAKADRNEDRREARKEAKAEAPKQEATKPDAKETPSPILPPADMDAEEKDTFLKADPKLQSYLSRRAYETRSTLSREMQKIQDRSKQFDGIEAEIAPHREWMATKGIREPDLVRRAIAWEQKLERDRVPAAKEWLAAQGIDPYELIDENGQAQEQNQTQGQPRPLTPEEVEHVVQQSIQRERALAEQSFTTANHLSVVEKFKQDKPLFRDPATASQLEAEMAPIIEAVVRSNPSIPPEKALEQAYSYVTKGNDQFSSLLNSFSQREQADKARVEAEKAREGRSVSGGLAGSNRSSTGLSFREEMRLRMNGGM
jgi:hypothetical protein